MFIKFDKFATIEEAIENNEKLIACKPSSGRSVAYETINFDGYTKGGNIRFEGDFGSKFQVKEDEWGNAIMVGKARQILIKTEDFINDNWFKCNVL